MPRKKKVKKNSYSAQRKIKKENRNKIITALLRSPLTFGKLLEQTELSPMGLTKHLHELEKLGQIGLDIYQKKRVYVVIAEKIQLEDLIVEELMKCVGSFGTYKILEASSKGEKEVHVEAFYDVQKFIDRFIKKTFMLVDIDHKTLLNAFKKRYGEPTI